MISHHLSRQWKAICSLRLPNLSGQWLLLSGYYSLEENRGLEKAP